MQKNHSAAERRKNNACYHPKTAIQDDNVMQDLDLESLLMGADDSL